MTDVGDIRVLFQQVGSALTAIESLRCLVIEHRNQSHEEHSGTKELIEQNRARVDVLFRRLDALEAAALELAELKRPVEELITLRHRLLGGLFVLGVIGSMIYSLAHGAGSYAMKFLTWLDGG
jgi:hypothetical protein